MKIFASITSIALLAICAAAGAATPESQVMGPINAFKDGFNRGDMKAVVATLLPSGITVIDDPTPHLWTGPKAFEAWGQSLEASDKAEGHTNAKVSLGKPLRLTIEGDHAYVSVPAVYQFKMNGAAMVEEARAVFVLQKEGGSWLIAAFSWAGTKEKPAANHAN